MKPFADMHIHMLPGVDDGAKTMEDALKILDAARRDGTKAFCLTPHFYPGMFGDNHEAVKEVYRQFVRTASERFPDVRFCLGNELRYNPNCLSWLQQGICRTMNDTSCVLVDFAENEEASAIENAVYRLLNGGFQPILAHVERYRRLRRDCGDIHQFSRAGALIQIDGPSVFGGWGAFAKRRSRKLIERGFVDLVGSDAHDTAQRPPQLSQVYTYIKQTCGEDYADAVLCENAISLLQI